jgi:drug/metabolite transporter (DMT)-like permease
VTSKTKAHLAVLGTNLFFAANYSLVKLISPALVKPFGVNIFRVGISLLLFWLVWLLGKSEAGIRKKDIGRFLLCGLTGITINQTLFIKGLTLTSTVHASLLTLTTPLLITILAFWVLKETLTLYKAVGLALGIGGSALLILSKESTSHATNYLLGDLLIVINAISYALYFILVKPLMQHYSPLHVIRWVFTFGFIMILPIGIQDALAVDFSAFEPVHFFSLAGVVLTGTFLAYFFNTYGIQHLGASITGSYIYTQPVFAVLIATFVLHEGLSWQKVAAAVLIFGGVFMVNSRRR